MKKILKILKAEVTVISYKEFVAGSVLHLQNGNLVKIRNHCIYRSFFLILETFVREENFEYARFAACARDDRARQLIRV